MSSFISAAPVASGQVQSLDSLRGHSLPSDAMIVASATQVNPTNQNPGSYAIVESAGATTTIGGSVPAVTLSPFADTYKEGSMYFPGAATSNISATLGSSYNWGLGLTAEAWVYYTSFTGATQGGYPATVQRPCLLGAFQPNSLGSDAWSLGADVNGKLTFYYYAYTAGNDQSANTNISLALNTWNHVAVSIPSGGPGSLYINGIQQTSNTNVAGSVAALSASTFTLNGSPYSTYNYLGVGGFAYLYTTGYVADARVVYGAALYTGSSFTVPSAPLSIATSGTTALLLRAGQNSPTIQNGALTFDRGLKQYMNFGPQTFNVATQGFTAVCRVKFSGTTPQYERIFEFASSTTNASGANAISLWLDTGAFVFRHQQVSTTTYTYAFGPGGAGSGIIVAGQTYVVTTRYDPVSQTMTVWVNGIAGTPQTLTTANAVDRTLTYTIVGEAISSISGSYVNDPYGLALNGTMNTLAIYNRALSNAEILTATQALNTVPATPQQKTLEIGDINGVPALSVAGNGQVSVQSIGLSSNVVQWPPAAMTGYDTVINGGVYKARASTEYTPGGTYYYAWYAFDKTSTNQFSSGTTYNTSSPYNYTGTVTTTDVNGTVYPGEWLQIQQPSSVILSSYSLTPSTSAASSQSPSKWVVLGSRDGVNWTLVDSRSGVASWSNGVLQNFSGVSSTQAYTYFRIVVANSLSSSLYTISEWTLYGTADASPSLTIAPATTFNTSVATPSLVGVVNNASFVPQDFSSSGLNIPAYVVSNTATVANTVAYSSFGPFAGEGSLYFPGGTGAYVNFGTAVNGLWPGGGALTDGTIEMWVYLAKYNTNNTILLIREGNLGVSTLDWYFYINTAGALAFYLQTSVTNYSASGGTVPLNTWSHVAFTMKAGFMTVFLNGVAGGTTTTATGTVVNTSSESLVIGNYQTSAGFTINGYISNMRLTTGQALYTTTFTPPTGPLQPIQGVTQAGLPYGTVLLLRNAPAPGRIQTTRLTGSNSGSVLSFPPAAMTGYSTALNAGYGQGTYVASASNEFDSGTNTLWHTFDKSTSTLWTGDGSSYTSGNYVKSPPVTTVDVNGTSYQGEWIQLQMPSSIVLSSYQINSPGSQGPSLFYLLGSRDGVNWSLVDQRSGQVTNGTYLTYSVSSGQAFTYFRLVTNKISGGSSYVQIYEIVFNGQIEGLNINPDGKIGIGLANPSSALHVAGQVTASLPVTLFTHTSISTTYYNSSGTSVSPGSTGTYYYVVFGTNGTNSKNWTPTYTNGSRLSIPYSGLYSITFFVGYPGANVTTIELFISKNSGVGDDLNNYPNNLLALQGMQPAYITETTITTTAYLNSTDYINFGFYYGVGTGTINWVAGIPRTGTSVTLIQRTA